MSLFKPQVNFPLTFASPFSVMTHNSSEIFWLKHYMIWTERVHQWTIFQTLEYSNESSPNSSCHFWNHKAMVFSNFALLFSLLRYFPCIFLAQTIHILWQKESIKVKFLDFWSAGWRFSKLLMSQVTATRFEPTTT